MALDGVSDSRASADGDAHGAAVLGPQERVFRYIMHTTRDALYEDLYLSMALTRSVLQIACCCSKSATFTSSLVMTRVALLMYVHFVKCFVRMALSICVACDCLCGSERLLLFSYTAAEFGADKEIQAGE
jgi:hypothetical protein